MNGMYFDQMKHYIPNLNNLLNIIISAIHSFVNILLMYVLKGICKDSIKQYILNMNNLINIIFFWCTIFLPFFWYGIIWFMTNSEFHKRMTVSNLETCFCEENNKFLIAQVFHKECYGFDWGNIQRNMQQPDKLFWTRIILFIQVG